MSINTTASGPSSVYWALKPPEDLISELEDHEGTYFSVMQSAGFIPVWRQWYAQRYGLSPDSLNNQWETQNIGFDGEDEELLRFRSGAPASYLTQREQMLCRSKTTFKASATNTDESDASQVESADAAIKYVYEQCFPEANRRRLVSMGEGYGASYAWIEWDKYAGNMVDKPVEGAPMTEGADGAAVPQMKAVKTGSPVVRSLPPWSVVSNPVQDDQSRHNWRIVKETRVDRHAIAARFSEKRDLILAVKDDDRFDERFILGSRYDIARDEVTLRYFYHKATPECPNGRYFGWVGNVPLWDDPAGMPFDNIPVLPYIPEAYQGYCVGVSPFWDLISIQQLEDQLVSDAFTNLSAAARASCILEAGSLINVDDIVNGMRQIYKNKGEDAPTWTSSPSVQPQTFTLLALAGRMKQERTGQNATSRGEPPSNVQSGNMAALFNAQAHEFISANQAALLGLEEALANAMLDLLKRYADHGFVVELVGADERPYQRAFKTTEINGVRGVTMSAAPPMLSDPAQRELLVKQWLEAKPEDREKLIEVATTGQIKPAYRTEQTRSLRIKGENEILLKIGRGELQMTDVPGALFTDGLDELAVHYSLLDSPDARKNEMLMNAVMQHCQMHVAAQRNADPYVCAALKVTMPPPPSDDAGMAAHAASTGAHIPAVGAPSGGPSPQQPSKPQGNPSPGTDGTSRIKIPAAATPPHGSQVATPPPMPQ
jgi:hypothetical protein